MRNLYFKGENAIVKWSMYDKDGAPILYSGVNDITVVLTDKHGKSYTFTKSGAALITAGDATNEFKFEITEAMTTALSAGNIKARFTYKIANVAFASGFMFDIIEEPEFLTLQ